MLILVPERGQGEQRPGCCLLTLSYIEALHGQLPVIIGGVVESVLHHGIVRELLQHPDRLPLPPGLVERCRAQSTGRVAGGASVGLGGLLGCSMQGACGPSVPRLLFWKARGHHLLLCLTKGNRPGGKTQDQLAGLETEGFSPVWVGKEPARAPSGQSAWGGTDRNWLCHRAWHFTITTGSAHWQ